MDEKKLENVQEIEDAQLDEASGGTRLNSRIVEHVRAAAGLDGMRSRATADVQSIYAADEGQPVVVANPDMTLDKSIY